MFGGSMYPGGFGSVPQGGGAAPTPFGSVFAGPPATGVVGPFGGFVGYSGPVAGYVGAAPAEAGPPRRNRTRSKKGDKAARAQGHPHYGEIFRMWRPMIGCVEKRFYTRRFGDPLTGPDARFSPVDADSRRPHEFTLDRPLRVAARLRDRASFPLLVNEMGPEMCKGLGPSAEAEFVRSTNYLIYRSSRWFPMTRGTVLYTPSVMVLRDPESGELLDRNSPARFQVSVIGAVAAERPRCTKGAHTDASCRFRDAKDREQLHHDVNMVFQTAAHYGRTKLVIRPLGCDAPFLGPVHEMARVWRKYADRYGDAFERVVYCFDDPCVKARFEQAYAA